MDAFLCYHYSLELVSNHIEKYVNTRELSLPVDCFGRPVCFTSSVSPILWFQAVRRSLTDDSDTLAWRYLCDLPSRQKICP